MEEIIELIKKAEQKYKSFTVSINLYSDECGSIRKEYGTEVIFEFESLEDLRNHLNE